MVIACGRRRSMRTISNDDVMMNLIADNKDMMLTADFHDGLDFFHFPDTSGGVVRRTEKEQFNVIFDNITLKFFIIDGITPAVVDELTTNELAVIVADAVHKRIVRGRQNDSGIARLG